MSSNLSFEEKELEILRKAVDDAETRGSKKMAQSDFIKDINRGKVIEVRSIMQKGTSKGVALDSSCPLEDALKVLNNEKNNECSVVDDKGKKIGKVTLDSAISALFRDKSLRKSELIIFPLSV